MAKDEGGREQVTIGFKGGGALPLRLGADDRKSLMDALEKGGWQELSDADGTVRIDCSQVVYVRTESEEQRVGFGIS